MSNAKQSYVHSKELTNEQLASGLIISVNEARKLLAQDAKQYTDDELGTLINELTQLAQELFNTSILLDKQL